MKLVEISIKQPITITVGIILVILAGMIAVQKVPIQLTPTVEDTVISVSTMWEGASPQEIEQEIIDKQEERLQGIPSLKKMTSVSQDGTGMIRLEFQLGTPKEAAMREVSDKLREVPSYPENVDEPVVEASDPENRDYIAWVGLLTDDPHYDVRQLFDFADKRIKPHFERVAGISDVNVLGGMEREVQIRFDPVLLAQRGITLTQLDNAIRRTNLNFSAGALADGKSDVRVRTLGRFSDVHQVENTVIADTTGGPVYIRDMAEVVETYKEPRSFVRMNGTPILAMNFQREPGTNVIQVMDGLKAEIERLNAPGALLEILAHEVGIQGTLKLVQMYDQTVYIDEAIALVTNNIWLGGSLTVFVLLLFLRSIRSVIIIGIAIPISIVATIVGMVMFGRSVNVISLAGMAFCVGMVVDNAIVVLENIYRHMEMGKKPKQAAFEATSEVWGAVLASTMTTLIVFVPVLLIEDLAGQLFRDIAIAICMAVGMSLIVSITVIPSAVGVMIRKRRAVLRVPNGSGDNGSIPIVKRKWIDVAGWISWFVYTISGSTPARIVVMAVFIIVPVLGTEFLLPPIDYLPLGNRNMVFGMIIPPPGYNIQMQSELGRRIEAKIHPFWEAGEELLANGVYDASKLIAVPVIPMGDTPAPMIQVVPPPIHHYFHVGFAGMNFQGAVSLDPKRVIDYVPLFQYATTDDTTPGVLAYAFQFPVFRVGGSSGNAVQVDLVGPDLDKVIVSAESLFQVLIGKFSPYSVQPDPNNFNIPGPEIQVQPNMVRLAEKDLSVQDIGLSVQAGGDGAFIGEYQLGAEMVDLKLISNAVVDRTSMESLRNLSIATGNGQVVRLDSVADLVRVPAPQQINRVGRQRSVTLQFTPPPDLPLESAVNELQSTIDTLRQNGNIDRSVSAGLTGSASKLKALQQALIGDGTLYGLITSSLFLALLADYLMMCVLFQSFRYPFVIMFSVPLATFGGVLGLAIVHYWSLTDRYLPVQKMDVLTILGFVILAGVVVNNAILIVHQALNFLKYGAEGLLGTEEITPRKAIAMSVESRVRPIFMSSLTSVVGMMPLVLMPGSGSELYRGLGSVVVGGLMMSSVFTLVLVPVMLSFILRKSDALSEGLMGKAV